MKKSIKVTEMTLRHPEKVKNSTNPIKKNFIPFAKKQAALTFLSVGAIDMQPS